MHPSRRGDARHHDHAVKQIVSSFRPSANGFEFCNSWPDVPVTTIAVGGLRVPIGSAANGMCSGMVFAALDCFTSGRAIPSVDRPDTGEPLYEFIASRLIDSFNLPTGPLSTSTTSRPGRRDQDNWFSWLTRLRGREYVMLKKEWPPLR